MTEFLQDARAALRSRQGAGARYDAAMAPASDLDHARRATAYMARLLGNLTDEALAASSARSDVPRCRIVAAIGLDARVLAEAVAWVRSSGRDPRLASFDVQEQEVALAETLPARALRNLVQHAAIHLDVEWRDLDDHGWGRSASAETGATLFMRSLPRRRALTLWRAALDLHAGGRLADVPQALQANLPTTLRTSRSIDVAV